MPILPLLAALAAQVPPPIVDAEESGRVIIEYLPGEVRCDGRVETPTFVAQPVPVTGFRGQPIAATTSLAFRIDVGGRPLGIARPVNIQNTFFDTSDLAPALAAWRFAAGSERTGCMIHFSTRQTLIAAADIALVHRAYSLPHTVAAGEDAMRKRLAEASPDCFTPGGPIIRNRAFPDFAAIPQQPGTSSYAMVGYDIDRKGKPVRTRILSSDGNAALDAAAMKAVRESRFAPQTRTGCSYPYHRRQNTPIAAPPKLPIEDYRKADATCPSEGDWTLPPRLTFPEPFRRRAIEGWAIVRYDVAPWGETGNVVALASEPAAAFGEEAVRIIQRAKRPQSATGGSGCVERVVFKLPDGPPEPPAE